MIKKSAIWLVRALLPRLYFSRVYNRLKIQRSEAELELLPALIRAGASCIDVGAASGVYTVQMLETGATVWSFEPIPTKAYTLRKMGEYLDLKLQVEEVALSHINGKAKLRILVEDTGRSTIDPANQIGDFGGRITEVDVLTRRLDDYNLDNIGLIKIDVEGHELSVVKGAVQTIGRNKCNFLIECENRHKSGATKELFMQMTEYGYVGYFLNGKQLNSIVQFDEGMHQNEENIGGWKSRWARIGVYINNFIFVPKESEPGFIAKVSGLGFSAGRE